VSADFRLETGPEIARFPAPCAERDFCNAADIKLQNVTPRYCNIARCSSSFAVTAPILRRGKTKEDPMALDTQPQIMTYDAPKKDLYEIGEMPPLGHVPARMYAWAIRRERHGAPEEAMQLEVVDTWKLDSTRCWCW
jgi:hypothetical protein